MSLSPADVPGYKRRTGYCLGSLLKKVFKLRMDPQQCAEQCNTEKRCRAFGFDIRGKYKCKLKTGSCETPRTILLGRYIYDRCKLFEADMMFFIFLQLVLNCAPDLL